MAKRCAECCGSRYIGDTEDDGWIGIDGTQFGSYSVSVLLEGVLSRPGCGRRLAFQRTHTASELKMKLCWQLKMDQLGSRATKETYLEGREKRNRRRSVDRIEGQGKNQRRGRAGHCKKRPVESFGRAECLAPHIQQSESKQRRASRGFSQIDRRSCDGRRIEQEAQVGGASCRAIFSLVFFFFFFPFSISPRGRDKACRLLVGGWRSCGGLKAQRWLRRDGKRRTALRQKSFADVCLCAAVLVWFLL